jgi:hypothetical protein
MKKQLTTSEVIALWQWAVKNHNTNWGVWDNYPVSGCSYLQYDNNRLIVKFDGIAEYQEEKFKRIGWDRRIPGNEPSITFDALYTLIPVAERPVDIAPSYEFFHKNGNKFILKQHEYVNHKMHKISVVFPDGVERNNFTSASKYYSQLMECKPTDIVIFK